MVFCLFVLMGFPCLGSENLKEHVAWYREILWPQEIEKEYKSERQVCEDLVVEQELAKRFRKEFKISESTKANIKRGNHYLCYFGYVRNNIQTKDEPTEKEIVSYYESHKEEFREPETVSVQKVFLEFGQSPTEDKKSRVRSLAQKVYEKAKQGEDFTQLVEEYSVTKENEGIVGPFPRGRYNPVLTEKAFGLKPGEIGEPFHTKWGYFILKGIKKHPERITPLTEVSRVIQARLKREKQKEIRKQAVEKAMKDFRVKVHKDRYSPENYKDNPTAAVIEGEGFRYTKKDLGDIFRDFYPDKTRDFSSDFRTVTEMILISELFRHSPEFREQKAVTQLEFIENYHLSKAYLEEKAGEKNITEEEFKEYYEEHKNEYLTPIERELGMIRIRIKADRDASPPERHYAEQAAKKKAEEALSRLKKGEDFESVAREFSEDPSSKKGGYLGWIRQPSTPVLDVTAAELEPGEFSEIKQYKDAFTIVKLISEKKRVPRPLEEVKKYIVHILKKKHKEQIRDGVWEKFSKQCDCFNQE